MKRVQRKRTKGWRMPENTIYVGRPTRWSNPYKVTDDLPLKESVRLFEDGLQNPNGEHQEHFERMRDNLSELKGKNLACFCSLDKPCHADVLLKTI